MDITAKERELLRRIADNPYSGGSYERAALLWKVCSDQADRDVLDSLCRKGLAEKGFGATVAGDRYDGCWLTALGKAEV
jgi:hypothetical protein